jgi:hypothetical protein
MHPAYCTSFGHSAFWAVHDQQLLGMSPPWQYGSKVLSVAHVYASCSCEHRIHGAVVGPAVTHLCPKVLPGLWLAPLLASHPAFAALNSCRV